MRRVPREHPCVGRRYVPVISNNHSHPAVQVVTNDNLLTTEITVEVHDCRSARYILLGFEDSVYFLERIFGWLLGIAADNLSQQTHNQNFSVTVTSILIAR